MLNKGDRTNMISNKTERHHTVPKCYLKAWCDPDFPKNHEPYVWMFEKDGSKNRKRAPKNVLSETNFYTIERSDGSQDRTIERKLAQLEYEFSQLRDTKIAGCVDLTLDEKVSLLLFISAAFARTIHYHNHLSNFFKDHLKKYDKMIDGLSNASSEEIAQWESMATTNSHTTPEDPLNENDIRELAKRPVPRLLPIFMNVMVQHLAYMNMTVFTTNDAIGFITSDSPVGMYDMNLPPEPSIWNNLSLGSPTIEVVMPISPEQCVFFTKQIFSSGYFDAPKSFLDEYNRRHRFCCDSNFIVRKNYVSSNWFSNEVSLPSHDKEDF